MARIALRNIEFFAKVGHLEEEHRIGSRILVDVSFDADTAAAEASDELKDTVDYQAVYRTIKRELDRPSKLIEHAARRILDALHRDFPAAGNFEMTLTKMHPPVNGRVERVCVTLTSAQK